MSETVDRYEFRAFAPDFGAVAARLRYHTAVGEVAELTDIYLVTHASTDYNAKIRRGQLDVKRLVRRDGDLEQWSPQFKADFPLATDVLQDDLLEALGVEMPSFSGEVYEEARFLHEIAYPHRGIAVAHVFKRRYQFTGDDWQAEVDDLLVNGAGLQSIAIESPDPEVVRETRRSLGLDNFENVNYQLALQRLLGITPPGEVQWRR